MILRGARPKNYPKVINEEGKRKQRIRGKEGKDKRRKSKKSIERMYIVHNTECIIQSAEY